MPQYEPILVEHPIQPKTEGEVRQLADQVMAQIVSNLLRQSERQVA